MSRIGIPRALLYYHYYPMWRAFFEGLGAEVVVSPPTTKLMLAEGSARVVADTCLPVKVFLGHVLALVDKCDWIFIPAVSSVKKGVYNCSKFLGLPDMTRAVIPESPPILEIDIDVNKGRGALRQAIYKLGRHFTWNPLLIRQASLAAWQAHLDYRELMSCRSLTPPEAITQISGVSKELNQRPKGRIVIAIIGHPYLLYDEYLNHQLILRLRQLDCEILTPEMLGDSELESAMARLERSAYWTYEEEVVGAGGHYLQDKADGVIGALVFGCGPDSLMIDTVRRQAARLKSIPFMSLTMEEHTAEGGIVTRLEAFTDMIARRKRGEGVELCA